MEENSQKQSIDWQKLFYEYVIDRQMSYQKLADTYHIPVRVIELTGHKEDWPGKRTKVMEAALKRIQQKAIEDIVAFREKQQKVGKLIAGRGIEQLAKPDYEPKTPKEVLAFTIAGMKLEAWGLGLDPDTPNQIQNTTINVSSQPAPTMTWADGTPLPPYPAKLIETFEEEQAWLKEEELKKQQEQVLSSQTS